MSWLKDIGLLILLILCIVVVYFTIFNQDRAFDSIQSEAFKTSDTVSQIARQIKLSCLKDKSETCLVLGTKDYIEHRVNYKEKGFLEQMFQMGNDINTTLTDGNNCVGISALGANILHQLNVSNCYVIWEKTHIFLGVDETNNMIFIYGKSKTNSTITSIKRLW
jgi:hypothetical protein